MASEEDRLEVTYQADLRYAGQAFQITVDFTAEDTCKTKGIALLTEQFDAEHEQLFTFKLGDGHEILNDSRNCRPAAATLKADITTRRWQTAAHARKRGFTPSRFYL